MSFPIENPPPPPRHYRLMQAMVGPLMKRFGLSCREFAELSSLPMDRPLTPSEAFRFRFHSMMCSVCRRLPGQFESIREALRSCEVRETHEAPVTLESLDTGVKERILARLSLSGEIRRGGE